MIELVKYRDAGLPTFTYFYVIEKRVVSPYFNSEQEATEWLKEQTDYDAE